MIARTTKRRNGTKHTARFPHTKSASGQQDLTPHSATAARLARIPAHREEPRQALLHLGDLARVRRPTGVLQAPEPVGDGHGDGVAVQDEAPEQVGEGALGLLVGRDGEVAQLREVAEVGVGDGLDLPRPAQPAGEGEQVHGALGDPHGHLPVEELGIAEAVHVDEAAAPGAAVAVAALGGVAVHVSQGEGRGLPGRQGEELVHRHLHGGVARGLRGGVRRRRRRRRSRGLRRGVPPITQTKAHAQCGRTHRTVVVAVLLRRRSATGGIAMVVVVIVIVIKHACGG